MDINCMGKKKNINLQMLSRVLAIIGGVLDIVYSVYGIIQGRWIGLIGICIGILVLISTKIIQWNKLKLEFNWWTILILGVISLFTACTIPAIILIIAAILLLV